MLDFSKALQLDDEYMTPVQIYAALKERAKSGQRLIDLLERIRAPLAVSMECRGFGAVLLADTFWEILTVDHDGERITTQSVT